MCCWFAVFVVAVNCYVVVVAGVIICIVVTVPKIEGAVDDLK